MLRNAGTGLLAVSLILTATDATADFDDVFHSDSAKAMLADYEIGTLSTAAPAPAASAVTVAVAQPTKIGKNVKDAQSFTYRSYTLDEVNQIFKYILLIFFFTVFRLNAIPLRRTAGLSFTAK